MIRQIVISLFTACALTCGPSFASNLDDYVAMATGSFSSAAQAAQDKRYGHVNMDITEIWHGGKDKRWLYVESRYQGQPPYRQRINLLELQPDGSLRSTLFALPDPESWAGAWATPERFNDLTQDQLSPLENCVISVARAGKARFESGTTGQGCDNQYKGASYAISKRIVEPDHFINWDRGFSADGTLVWGPAAGGYRFVRVDTSECANPVYMLVYGDIFDRKAFGKYVGAINESGLYPKLQGYYTAISPAAEVFEGDVPATRGVVLVRFPCIEKARAFWNSPEYREIVKLRDGIATFEVMVFKAQPVPEYVEWE